VNRLRLRVEKLPDCRSMSGKRGKGGAAYSPINRGAALIGVD
jgi:hypothetical protein